MLRSRIEKPWEGGIKFVLIGFAGGIGVLLRFVVSGWGQKLAPGIFPLGTVIVNVTG